LENLLGKTDYERIRAIDILIHEYYEPLLNLIKIFETQIKSSYNHSVKKSPSKKQFSLFNSNASINLTLHSPKALNNHKLKTLDFLSSPRNIKSPNKKRMSVYQTQKKNKNGKIRSMRELKSRLNHGKVFGISDNKREQPNGQRKFEISNDSQIDEAKTKISTQTLKEQYKKFKKQDSPPKKKTPRRKNDEDKGFLQKLFNLIGCFDL
jgi:hypothetical protein